MERTQLRTTVSDLIIVRSERVTFHPLLITQRGQISPLLANNLEFVCLDAKPDRSLVVCKQCHTVFYNETWNRPNIRRHLSRFHAIAETEEELKPKPKNKLQATRDALKHQPILPNESSPTALEVAPPSLLVKKPHRRRPSQEVTQPQDTEANALTTLETVVDKKPAAKKSSHRRKVSAIPAFGTDEFTLGGKKPTTKKRSHRHKPSAEDVPLKKKKQQVPSGKEGKATMFEDKTNF